MKILITGSSGQIGTNLALALCDGGHSVVGVDIRKNGWVDSIETVIADLNDPAEGFIDDMAGAGFDCVVHLAAHAKVYELVENPSKALENVKMIFTALEISRKGRIPFVFGSSREVYGDITRHTTEEAHADFVIAESPYSASKIAGEAFVYSYSRCYRVPHLVFRFSNVYGRYDNDIDRLERVVPLFISKIESGEAITIYGPEKILDFTYVADCVAGVASGVERLVDGRIANETINLAYGEGRSLGELVEIISKTLSVKAKVTSLPTRPGEVTRYVADISKAQRLLDYKPTTPLCEGVPREIQWSREWKAEHH